MMAMKAVSIDIETTGLDPDFCQVIEFAAVVDDFLTPVEELPTFHRYLVHERLRGEAFALSMHSTILRRIATSEPGFQYIRPEALGHEFAYWLITVGGFPNGTPVKFTAEGKNFGSFDLQFLKKIDGFIERAKPAHRALDPAILYFDPTKDDRLPDMATCLERAALDPEVKHEALDDARQVVQLLRRGLAY